MKKIIKITEWYTIKKIPHVTHTQGVHARTKVFTSHTRNEFDLES